MQDLFEWLPGSYSSAALVYFEAASGAPPSGPHEQVYREISRIDAPQVGEFVLFSQVRRGGKSGPLPEAQPTLLVLEYDPARRTIAMSGRRIRDAGQLAGRADRAHLRLAKLRDHECLFEHQAPSGEPLVVNGPQLNDGGDTYVWELPGSPPRKVHLELLRLSLFEGEPEDGRKERTLLGFGWAGAASDRAAFNSREFSGRCTRYDPSMPPPK